MGKNIAPCKIAQSPLLVNVLHSKISSLLEWRHLVRHVVASRHSKRKRPHLWLRCIFAQKRLCLRSPTIDTTDPPSSNLPVIEKSIKSSKRCFGKLSHVQLLKRQRDHPGKAQGTNVNNTANLSMLRHLTNSSKLPVSGIMDWQHQRLVSRSHCPSPSQLLSIFHTCY